MNCVCQDGRRNFCVGTRRCLQRNAFVGDVKNAVTAEQIADAAGYFDTGRSGRERRNRVTFACIAAADKVVAGSVREQHAAQRVAHRQR